MQRRQLLIKVKFNYYNIIAYLLLKEDGIASRQKDPPASQQTI